MEPRLPRGRAKAVLHMRNAFSNKKGNAGWERKGSGFLSLVGLSERRSSFWLLCPPRVHSRCSSHVLPRLRKQGVSSTPVYLPQITMSKGCVVSKTDVCSSCEWMCCESRHGPLRWARSLPATHSL